MPVRRPFSGCQRPLGVGLWGTKGGANRPISTVQMGHTRIGMHIRTSAERGHPYALVPSIRSAGGGSAAAYLCLGQIRKRADPLRRSRSAVSNVLGPCPIGHDAPSGLAAGRGQWIAGRGPTGLWAYGAVVPGCRWAVCVREHMGSAAVGAVGVGATGQPGNRATGQPGNRATGQPGNRATGQPGNRATGQPGNWATGQPGNRATGPMGQPAPGARRVGACRSVAALVQAQQFGAEAQGANSVG